MTILEDYNIDEETISKLHLQLSHKNFYGQLPPNARVFEYPQLADVYIMESDLYGNLIPKGFCFIAFYGIRGLIGKYLRLTTLQNATVEDIKAIVQRHSAS